MNTIEKRKKGKGVLEKRDHTHANPKVRLAAVEKAADPEPLRVLPVRIGHAPAVLAVLRGLSHPLAADVF